MTKIISFTVEELVEIRRALDLIIQEDEDCKVNIDTRSRAAKKSAYDKVRRALGMAPRVAS